MTGLGLLAAGSASAALVTFVVYIGFVFVLAWLSNRLLRERNFLSEYFLGSRSLGMWAFAFTFAATSASGGSFTGFPSKIYVHGWILGLWIASYLVYPICTMGFFGKRLNQVARISGAITIPDVLRDRFRSPSLGLIAVSLIVFFMAFNLVAQFKSGSEILRTLLRDVELFHVAAAGLGNYTSGWSWLAEVPSDYLLCLLLFAVCVIVYTTYGGFHAVVWTDVLQGVVMVIGVIILLPLAIVHVGGMRQAGKELVELEPPRLCLLELDLAEPIAETRTLPAPWLLLPPDRAGVDFRLFRLGRDLKIDQGRTRISYLPAVEIMTASEVERQLSRLVEEENLGDVDEVTQQLQQQSVVWLDQSMRELVGNEVQVRQTYITEYAYGQRGSYVTGPGPQPARLPKDPGTLELSGAQSGDVLTLVAADGQLVDTWEFDADLDKDSAGRHAVGAGNYRIVARRGDNFWEGKVAIVDGQDTVISLPGGDRWQPGEPQVEPASPRSGDLGFLPFGLAISFFFMCAISGTGQPGYMVRLMAFKDATTLRRGIATVAIYYSFIYLPLVIIFVLARLILPGMDLESDRIMPQMTVTLTAGVGQAWLAGLLVAAPFAAVMSTVDSFLLLISSALVRDIYQRNVHPGASEKLVKRFCYGCTLIVGTGATIGAMNPPAFLQDIIVYTGSGLAACFLAPMAFALYWPRCTRAGAIAGMVGGFSSHLAMYMAGWFVNGDFYRPIKVLGMNPVVVGIVSSFLIVFIVSLVSRPLPDEVIKRYFMRPRRRSMRDSES